MPSNHLSPRDAYLARFLPALAPVPALPLPVDEAVGLASAGMLRAPVALPVDAVALRPGLAIAAEDTLGATAHEPAFLATAPNPVTVGEAMPPGTNAVVDLDMINRATSEVFATAAPGAGVRLPGHDLRAGGVIIEEGQRIGEGHLAVLSALNIRMIETRAPRVSFLGFEPWLERLLRSLAVAAGCRIDCQSPADFIVEATPLSEPVLAIAPGGYTQLTLREAHPALQISPRFDSALAGFLLMGLPVIAQLSRAHLNIERRQLGTDIRNQTGFSTLALLCEGPSGLVPCMIGEITLEGLVAATHVATLQPEIEGYPAGAVLEVMALDRPLIR